jgi:hypothetical protein
LSRANLRLALPDYQSICENAATYNGTMGWHIEAQGRFDGREVFVVQWLVATNGFGYQCTIWGPVELKSEIKHESEPMFLSFQPTSAP